MESSSLTLTHFLYCSMWLEIWWNMSIVNCAQIQRMNSFSWNILRQYGEKIKRQQLYPPPNEHRPCQIDAEQGVGRFVSTKNLGFSGSMLIWGVVFWVFEWIWERLQLLILKDSALSHQLDLVPGLSAQLGQVLLQNSHRITMGRRQLLQLLWLKGTDQLSWKLTDHHQTRIFRHGLHGRIKHQMQHRDQWKTRAENGKNRNKNCGEC